MGVAPSPSWNYIYPTYNTGTPNYYVSYQSFYADNPGIILRLGNLESGITYSGTYSITNNSGGTVVGPLNYSFQWTGPAGDYYSLPAVAVPDASNYYGFIITQDPYTNAINEPNAAITVFHASTPIATPTSPANGAQISTLTPSLAFNFTDPDPDIYGEFGAYQVQVQRVSDSVSFWDTGTKPATSAQSSANAATITYAGTALSWNVAYRWRVRVQNEAGTWSNYSAWNTFTPSNGPSAPTGIHPAGLTQSLTPTVSGTYVQGSGATESAFEYVVYSGGILIFDSGWVTGTLATGQAYAGTGSAALQWATAYTLQVRSKDSAGGIGPYCTPVAFNTDGPPNAPTNITPSGGAVVNTSTPTLGWQHNDPYGDAQTEADILLYDLTASAWVTGYGPTPKVVTQSTQSHTVTTALTLNHQYQLQVRTVGLTAAGAGPYSAATTFTYAAAPNVTMTSPTSGSTITAPSFPVTWTFSGGSGTQQDYRVQVFAADGITSVYDSGVVAGTALTATVPAGTVFNGNNYTVHLTVRDTLSQSAILSPVPVTVAFTPPNTLVVTATAIGGQL